jgi:hypothetical protein
MNNQFIEDDHCIACKGVRVKGGQIVKYRSNSLPSSQYLVEATDNLRRITGGDTKSGMSFVTTALAPMTQFQPMRQKRTLAFSPSQELSPIMTGPFDDPDRLRD